MLVLGFLQLKARFNRRASPCESFGGRSGTGLYPSISVLSVNNNPLKLHNHFHLIRKASGRRTRGPLGCFMLSVAIFVTDTRTTKITRFSPLGIPLMAIFKRAVREPAHEKGYVVLPPQTRNWTHLLQTLKKLLFAISGSTAKESKNFKFISVFKAFAGVQRLLTCGTKNGRAGSRTLVRANFRKRSV